MKSNRRVSLTFIVAVAAILSLSAPSALRAADAGATAANLSLSAPKVTAETPVGEYVGTYVAADSKTMLGVAKVFVDPTVKPNGGLRAALYAVESGLIHGTVISDKTQCEFSALLTGSWEEGTHKEPYRRLLLADDKWHGGIGDDRDRLAPWRDPWYKKLVAGSKDGRFELARYDRKSPTLGAAPPAGAIVLLDYKPGKAPSLAEWTNDKWKVFNDGSIMVTEGNNYTKRQFSNFRLHAEFMVVCDKGGGGGNSGFYLLDRYEVQVLDSFGRRLGKGNCAAIYLTIAPSANACLPPGAWQTYDITFRGPVMEGKEVKKHPRITVVHNGVRVHDDVEIPHATGVARARGDVAEGPIMLQNHDSPARFRNIWLVEIPGQ
jgi:hypothetical protein